jgi:hypothetical protein
MLYHKIGLTGNNGGSYSRTILCVVGNDVFTLFTKDVNQSSVHTLSELGVFLKFSPVHQCEV